MDMKTCSRCGTSKPVDNFRNYYGGRKGSYKYCKECERIESRRQYLLKLGDQASPEQLSALAAIEQLYDAREAAGLEVPGRRGEGQLSTDQLVMQLLSDTRAKEVL